MCNGICSDKIEGTVWRDLALFKPVIGKAYLTTAFINGKWTAPVVAFYYEDGRFIMGYDFHTDRVVQVAIETKPTHFAELPNGKSYN